MVKTSQLLDDRACSPSKLLPFHLDPGEDYLSGEATWLTLDRWLLVSADDAPLPVRGPSLTCAPSPRQEENPASVTTM